MVIEKPTGSSLDLAFEIRDRDLGHRTITVFQVQTRVQFMGRLRIKFTVVFYYRSKAGKKESIY